MTSGSELKEFSVEQTSFSIEEDEEDVVVSTQVPPF